jgi:hypothetical protein
MPVGTRNATVGVMFNEPPGANNHSSISSLPSSEQERAVSSLRRQARSLEAKSFRCVEVDPASCAGALPAPHFVFFLDDGRALAWLDETHPYVVHPSFADLCDMHGLKAALVHAA